MVISRRSIVGWVLALVTLPLCAQERPAVARRTRGELSRFHEIHKEIVAFAFE